MPAAGRKCTECDSYQDWRRFFGIATPSLSLMVALVAVLSATIPVIKTALTPLDSKLSYHFSSFSYGHVYAFVSNSGARPAQLTALHVGSQAGGAVFRPVQRGALSIVEPGKTIFVDYGYDSDTPRRKATASDKNGGLVLPFRCYLGFSGVRFTGSEETVLKPVECAVTAAIIRAARGQPGVAPGEDRGRP